MECCSQAGIPVLQHCILIYGSGKESMQIMFGCILIESLCEFLALKLGGNSEACKYQDGVSSVLWTHSLMYVLGDTKRSVLCCILNSVSLKVLSHLLHLSSLPTNHFFSTLSLGPVKCIRRLCHRILDTVFHPCWLSWWWLVSKCHSQAISKLDFERGSVENRTNLRCFHMKINPKWFWGSC